MRNRIKRIQRALCLGVLPLLMAGACTNEPWETESVPEGKPTTIQIEFHQSVPEEVVVSRAAGMDEDKINDLYLMVFDSNGNREELTQSVFTLTANQGVLGKITVLSGRKYICAVGNVNDNTHTNITRAKLDDIQSVAQLNDLKISFLENTVSHIRKNFLMYGDAGESVDVGPGNTVTPVHIILRRLITKVRFEFRSGMKEGKKITFVPRAYRVVNSPKTSYLRERLAEDGATVTTDFFNTDVTWEKDSKQWGAELDANEDGSYSFDYYQYENRKSPKQPVTSYDQREKQEKQSGESSIGGSLVVENGPFVYAPDLATYVEVTGDYYEEASINSMYLPRRFANVKYQIHLGYVNNVAGDFNVNRNTSYLYRVMVNGVNDIIVEAQAIGAENERDPRAEGDVRDVDHAYRADAHYETFKMIFKKSDLFTPDGKIKGGFGNTPGKLYATLSDPFGTTEVQNGGSNSNVPKWLRFSVNLSVFGTDLFGDGKILSYTNTLKYRESPWSATQLMDIQQLVNYLANIGNYEGLSGDGEISLTAYLDEYYYEDKPTASFVNAPNRNFRIYLTKSVSPDGLSTYTAPVWSVTQASIASFYKEGVAGFGVEMEDEQGPAEWYDFLGLSVINWHNISPYNGRYNTLMLYRSILERTESNANWKSALGTTTRVIQGDVVVPEMNPNTNVRTYNIFQKNGTWNKGRAFYGCLARNRDENGDGIINPSEIKWYIPSTEQLIELVIGQSAYSSDYRLLKPNNLTANGDNNIYSSSTYTVTGTINQAFNTYTMLADLYNTVVRDDDIESWFRSPKHKGRTYCVRNFGMAEPVPTEPVPNYNSYDKNNLINYPMPPSPLGIKDGNGNPITFSNGKMNLNNGLVIYPVQIEERTLRQEILKTGELPMHLFNNRQVNSIYKKGFRLNTGNTLNEMTISEANARLSNGLSPCATYIENGIGGWRLPNAAELSAIVIMTHRYANEKTGDYNLTFNISKDYLSITKQPYPMNAGRQYYKAVRMGAPNPGYLEVGAGGDNVLIRCVKDYDGK